MRKALPAIVLAILLFIGFRPIGPLPPIGPLLDPANGVWASAAAANFPARQLATIPGLHDSVLVLIDDRGVPHIFASSEDDVWRVLGYVVARDRLFQMEAQTRAATGRLTEWAGERALETDRESRALGLAWGAEKKAAAYDRSSPAWQAMQAYADGVNAWISHMRPRDLPLEYRLLKAKPIKWEPIHSFYFLSRMSLTLGLNDATTRRLRAQALVGKAAADALFPLNSPVQEPIQPNGQSSPRFDFAALPAPGAPDLSAAAALTVRSELLAAFKSSTGGEPSDAVGSNNWAVAPSRSSTGNALLAGDPHLDLTLPSVWYEMHVVVPGKLDAAGVGFPGMPGVVIGFNRNVAWTFTNTGSDVNDFYEEKVDDANHPSRYLVDSQWRNLEKRIEKYRSPSGSVIATDTLYFTHRGPMRRILGKWLSMRWTAYEPSHEPDNFMSLSHTRSVNEWLYAMRDYIAPTQNGLVADQSGNIAIRSSGAYPIRPGDGRGDVIRDGSKATSDWTGFLPVERFPFSMNPQQGYLASANQQPVDPRQNPAYMGSSWYSPWRAMRINSLLRSDAAVTPDKMRLFQTDPGSARADAFVPLFLNAAAHEDSIGNGSPKLTEAAKLLAEWDRRYVRDNRRAVIFEAAMRDLARRTWDELADSTNKDSREALSLVPESQILLELATTPSSPWWDDRRTPVVEDRDAILAASLVAGYDTVTSRNGAASSAGWIWSNRRKANIRHLLRIPALGALGIPLQGGPGTLNPSSGDGTQGASWRMVVEMGPEIRAWSIYP
ncbi:MAG TPA: penicillin acylase family protein, partial [Gemmatimonadaceae bacterium]|nr:penicillin acylase family protein [Gemmatimonadaceae bacterium]